MATGSNGQIIQPNDYSANGSTGAELFDYPGGLLVQPSDLLEDNDAVRRLLGTALAIMTGNLNFLPAFNPVQVLPGSGNSGLQILLGGNGQCMVVQGRVANFCPQVAININPPDATRWRTDLIVVQYARMTDAANPVNNRNVETNGQVQTGQTVYKVLESWDVQYAVGGLSATQPPPPPAPGYQPLASDPAVPAGYVALARIVVPPGLSVTLTNSNVQVLFPTLQQILAALTGTDLLPSTFVTAIDGKVGALQFKGVGGITVDDSKGPNEIDIEWGGGSPFVGFSAMANARVTPGNTVTVQLDSPLPGDINTGYRLYARGSVLGGGTLSLTGGGGKNVTWDQNVQQANLAGVMPAALIGVCTGGTQPLVTAVATGAAGNPGTNDNVLELWAVCTNLAGGAPPIGQPAPVPTPPGPAVSSVSQTIGGTLVVAPTPGFSAPPGGSPPPSGPPGRVPREGCPSVHQVIETRERGFVFAGTLEPGEHLRDPLLDGEWNEILRVKIVPDEILRVTLRVPEGEDYVDVNASHAFMDTSGEWVLVRDMAAGHDLGRGVTFVSVESLGAGLYAALACERQRYMLCGTVSHNSFGVQPITL